MGRIVRALAAEPPTPPESPSRLVAAFAARPLPPGARPSPSRARAGRVRWLALTATLSAACAAAFAVVAAPGSYVIGTAIGPSPTVRPTPSAGTASGTAHPPRIVPDVRATATLPGHDASQLVDGRPATYWAAPLVPGRPVVLTFEFSRPVEVAALEFESSTGGRRPAILRITLDPGVPSSTPHAGSIPVTLTDSPEPQPVTLPPHGAVRTVEIRILSTYPDPGPAVVAINSVDFF